MARHTRILGMLLLGAVLLLTSACSALFTLGEEKTQTEQEKKENEALEKKENEALEKKPLVLKPYAEEVGARLKEPEYEEFAANALFTVSGSAKEYERFRSPYAMIEVRAMEEGIGGRKFIYYAPLTKGSFAQNVRLFNGKGEYRVTVRLPSTNRDDYYYDIADFKVINVNPTLTRDIELTSAGKKAELAIETPASGFVKSSESFQLKGSLKLQQGSQPYVMVKLEKDSDSWKNLVPVKNGTFTADIPLYYGKGVHELTVLVPKPGKGNYYEDAAILRIDNTSEKVSKPIEFSKMYQERGLQLDYPKAGGDEANLKYRIAGSLDPNAKDAAKTTHLIVQTKKGEDKATYFVPITDYKFDDEFWLRFGPGKYEVTVNVPEIQYENRDYYKFFQAAAFEVNNTAIEDKRDLLPSRGIQSDAPEIKQLAEQLTAGKQAERDKALAIYEYVAKNIIYDVPKYQNDEFHYDDSALKTLRERKGVCQDYVFLGVALFRSLGMESRFVEGYARGRHAWIETKVDGKWLTMDPTWGAGYIQDGKFVPKYDPQYFDPKPEVFNRTHSHKGVGY
ncbi:Transglutaminase-like superfamily protein [compost metagenome]